MKLFFLILSLALCHSHIFAADQLAYGLKPKEQVAYQVNIVFDSAVEKHTMSGVIVYTGKDDANGNVAVTYNGGLSSQKQAKSSGRPGFRRGPGGFRRPGGGPPRSPFEQGISFDGLQQRTSQLAMKPNGDMVSMKGETQLPYLLGNLSILPFEALPDEPESSWQTGNGITVTQENESRFPPRGPFRQSNTTVKTGGSEASTYEVKTTEGDLVTIAKTYHLDSPAVGEDDQAVTVDGEGTFVFNKALAMPESLDMKYSFLIKTTNTEIKVPLTVNYQRMSAEDFKAHQDKQAYAKANPGLNPNGEAWTKEQQDEIIAELKSDDGNIVRRQLVKLAARKPYPEETAVAEAIREIHDNSEGLTQRISVHAWKRWRVILPEKAE